MTEQEILDRLALYLAAEKRVLEGNQSYSVAGVTESRAELSQLRAEISRLRQELSIVQGGGSYGCQQVIFGGRR